MIFAFKIEIHYLQKNIRISINFIDQFSINLINMTLFSSIYKYLNILSLDIVFGVISGSIMAQKIFHLPINYSWLIILAISVWTIYTADHLLDSIKLKDSTPAERRLFYRKHFKLLLIIELILVLIVLYLSFKLFEIKLIKAGLIIGLLVVFYFLMVYLFNAKKTLLLQKEMIVALIYTAGIFIAPLSKVYPEIDIYQILIIISFFLIVWADILLIAIFEFKKDLHDNFTSLPVMIGLKNTARFMKFLLYTAFILIILINLLFPMNATNMISSIILFIMGISQIIIYKYRLNFYKNDMYRYVTEAIFFLPILMIFV